MSRVTSNNLIFAEYAAVGYLGKRIQMRKSRILQLQKMIEQRKAQHLELSQDGTDPPDHGPKQTVSNNIVFGKITVSA